MVSHRHLQTVGRCTQIRPDALAQAQATAEARRLFQHALRRSKARCGDAVSADLDNNPSGLGYKIATKQLRKPAPHPGLAENIDAIVSALFPGGPPLPPNPLSQLMLFLPHS